MVRPDPFANPPAYESLVGNLSCHNSRRSSIQHRFVYRVVQGAVVVDGEASIWAGVALACMGPSVAEIKMRGRSERIRYLLKKVYTYFINGR